MDPLGVNGAAARDTFKSESTRLRQSSASPIYPHRFFIVDKKNAILAGKTLAR